MKFRRLLYALILLFMSSVWGLADTTIPMKLNVSAVLRYSDGTEINTLTPEDIKIGLYLSDTEFVWQKTYSVNITNGLIEAVLSGTGTDSNGGSVVLNESLFEHENLKVGFTINEDGSEKLAIVNLTSQPYAIKSAISDVANLAEDTIKLRGVPIVDLAPENKDVLVYVDGEWMPTGLDNTMMNIDEYQLVTNDVTEISGTFENLKVEKILGKRLVSSVRNGSRIPTGAILMFSPDVDAPNGAFHPSSGNPEKGEFLAWDHINDVWMPTTNSLQKLDDVVPPVSSEGEAPSNNVLIYNVEQSRYYSGSIDLNYLSNVEVSKATDGSFLSYDGNRWEATTLGINDLSNVNISSAPSGKVLYHDGSNWDVKTMRLQDLADLDSGLAEGKIIIGKSGNQRFEYTDFKMDALNDVNITSKEIGYVLTWTGTEWKANKNMIESINELDDFNISGSPTGKYLYHDGTTWVDQSIVLVEKAEDLSDVGFTTLESGDLMKYNGDRWTNAEIDLDELKSVELDFTGQSSENPIDKFLAFSDGKWRNTTIELGEMKNVSVADASSGESLVYNGSNWISQTLNLGNLGNVTTGKRVDGSALEEGDILEYKAGNWVVKANELKDMVDVATGNIGANRILKLNNAGSGFVYEDYKISALRDVNLSDEASGRYLYYDGSEWIDKELNLVTSVQELSDVSLGTVADNQLLKYDLNREKWVNSELAFNEITEVELDFTGQSQISPIDKFLVFENGKWRNSTIDIGEMQNVNVDSAVTGNVLKYNGKAWVNGSPVTALSALTDVSLSGINNGDILKYNADTGEWENQQESSALLISELEGVGTKKEIAIKGNLLPGSGYSLGSDTNSWQNLYLESTGMMMGDSDNRAVITYDTDNKELVVQHSREDGITTSPINLRLQDGVALVGDSWETATDNIQAIAVWDGNVKNKITQSYDQLSFNSKTNAVGFGIGEPESKMHIQMTSESDIGGVRLSTTTDLDSYLNIYQGELADTISGSTVLRKPYLFHANVADSASKYHDIGFMIDTKSALYMSIQKDGETGVGGYSDVDDVYVGIGTRTPSEKLEVDGKVRATSMYIGDKTKTLTTNANIKLHVGGDAAVDGAIYISGGSDLAEGFHIVADKDVEPGTVVSIDPKNIGKLVVSDEAFDTKVAGVVSGGNGIKAGLVMTQTGTLADGEYPIALTGRVWVKCTNENGDIGIGDLLTTASEPGHAMKATGDNMQGAVLGKAMSTCGDNRMVLTLISLQ